MALLSHWKLDETSGTNVPDSVGANTGTTSGSPTWTSGVINGGLLFDGTDDYVSIANESNFDFTSDFSIALWLKTTSSSFEPLVGKASGSTGWDLDINSGIPRMVLRGTSTIDTFGDATQVINDDTWHHVAVVNTTTAISFYIDGVSKSTTNGTWTATTNNVDVRLGDRSLGEFFPGTLDDVRIYDHALSASEITAIYKGGHLAVCTHEDGIADTGATPNTSNSFTPVLKDLLVVFVVASATVQATATLTSSVGMTFTQFGSATYASSVNTIYGFVSNQLVSNAASQTVTFDTASDAATGTVIFVCAVAGMARVGLNAVRQSAKQDNGSASGTPAPAFSSTTSTRNPVLGCIGNNTSPAGLTAPSRWTEPASTGDLGYSSPTTGGEFVFRNSGFEGTTVTWGGTSASVFGALIVELDASWAVPVLVEHYRARRAA